MATVQSVTDLVAGRLAVGGWNALLARLKTDRHDQSRGGSVEERKEAYALFRRSAIEFRTSLAVLIAAPPRLVGALWSVPLHLRMLHRMPDDSSRLLDDFLAVHTVGRLPAIEAAEELLTRISAAVHDYSGHEDDRHAKRNGKTGVDLSPIDEALADFTLAVRRDLGFGDARTQSGHDAEGARDPD
ncbi:MAG: hypothetical protein HHJ10_01210 [Cellulomonas sp.]|uniref:hypothetical protein n=1 Tax=Cellulomonas sp. TaxID=40001 RepID=UPI0017B298E0|nr:hypothetical protein [Cellulomonas sp.]NMM29688.1 hypothetical protein [Cellulomonas sp.]